MSASAAPKSPCLGSFFRALSCCVVVVVVVVDIKCLCMSLLVVYFSVVVVVARFLTSHKTYRYPPGPVPSAPFTAHLPPPNLNTAAPQKLTLAFFSLSPPCHSFYTRAHGSSGGVDLRGRQEEREERGQPPVPDDDRQPNHALRRGTGEAAP